MPETKEENEVTKAKKPHSGGRKKDTLSYQEKLFAVLLLNPKTNVYQAAKDAGYTESVAKSDAYEWTKEKNPTKPRLKEYADNLKARLMQKVSAETGKKGEDVIKELTSVGFSNIADIINLKRGGVVVVKQLSNLPEEVQRCVKSVAETQNGLKVEFYDKIRALELLGKHFKVLTDKVEVDVKRSDLDVTQLSKEDLIYVSEKLKQIRKSTEKE